MCTAAQSCDVAHSNIPTEISVAMQYFLIAAALLTLVVNLASCQKCFDVDFDDFNPCSYFSKLELPYGDCGTELDSIQEASNAPLVTYYRAEVGF